MFTKYTTEITAGNDGSEVSLRASVVTFEDAAKKVHEAMLDFLRNPGGAPEVADALGWVLI
jgi:hypothetical protein